jgi:hypothetical protein
MLGGSSGTRPSWPNASRGNGDRGARLLDDAEGGAAGAGASSSDPTVAGIQNQIDAVRTTMQENVNVMVDNIEKGSNLEARSSALADQAQTFRATARTTRRASTCHRARPVQVCPPRARQGARARRSG